MIPLDQGACRDLEGTLFLPDVGDRAAEATAKRICKGCPVRLDCLSLALRSEHLDGIWGGLTARQRSRYATAGRA